MCTLPIIYHPDYNIDIDDLFGASMLLMVIPMTIDTHRYQKIVDYLQEHHIDHHQFITPIPATQKDLLMVHTDHYLQQVRQPEILAQIFEINCFTSLSARTLNNTVIKSQLLGTGGTIIGCQIAIQYGWAINLSGGYHHAKSDSGGGFCLYSDIGIAVKKLRQHQPNVKVLIVDLDAHQGNGYAEIFFYDPNVVIFDVYHQSKYPCMFQEDLLLRGRIDYNHPINSDIDDVTYLQILTTYLPIAIEESHPDLIIYNAGYDILQGDPFGGLNISTKYIIQRDRYVFELATQFKVPILMLIAGGYSLDISQIIGQSIVNLINLQTHISDDCQIL